MQMPKPSDADKEHFRSVLPTDPEVEVKPMFGNLGAFVHGNMFAGLFGPTIGVRLSEADRAELEASEWTVPFGPPERPMGGYVGLPEFWNADGGDDDARVRAWVSKAYAYVAGLPAKEPKASKPRSTKK
jgi:TfoX/Sxy family transcriptional regulator of competence genes